MRLGCLGRGAGVEAGWGARVEAPREVPRPGGPNGFGDEEQTEVENNNKYYKFTKEDENSHAATALWRKT